MLLAFADAVFFVVRGLALLRIEGRGRPWWGRIVFATFTGPGRVTLQTMGHAPARGSRTRRLPRAFVVVGVYRAGTRR